MKLLSTLLSLLLVATLHAQNFNMCSSTTSTTLASGNLFDSGGPSGNYGDQENCTFLIEPECAASITLNFSSFNSFSGDFIEVYDGDQILSGNRILFFSNTLSLPTPVTATSGKMLIRWVSNFSSNSTGFSASWTTALSAINPPIANYSTNVSNPNYNQTIQFFDGSINNPSSRFWNFGDSTFSTVTNPTKVYNQSGTYRVSLDVENCLGSNTRSQNLFVRPPTGFDAVPKIASATSTNCSDSVMVPIKLYNTTSSSMNFAITKDEGNVFEETINKPFNTLSATNFFEFRPLTEIIDGDVEVQVNLNGSFSATSRYADLYIEGGFIARLYSSSGVFTYPSSTVQLWLLDGKIDMELRNNNNVFILGGDYHEINLKAKRANWINITNQNIVVPANDSATLNVQLKAGSLTTGDNYGSIILDNGQTGYPFSILVNHQIMGSPSFSFGSASLNNYGTVQQFSNLLDTTIIKNIGCDTLFIDSISSSSSYLTQVSSIAYILPFSQENFISEWRPSTPGSNTDTLVLHTNAGDQSIFYSATATAAPFASVTPLAIYDTLTDCADSLVIPVTIKNPGSSTLKYYTNIATSFDSTSTVTYVGNGASSNHSFNINNSLDTLNIEITIDGDFDSGNETCALSIEGTSIQRLGGTGSFNYTYNFQFFGAQLSNWLADGRVDVNFQNTNSVNIFSSLTNTHSVRAYYSGSTSWISTSVDSGNVLVADSTTIDYTINDLFSNGDYQGNIYIRTNDAQGLVRIPVFLNVNGTAEAVFSDTCVHFGNSPQNATQERTIILENLGCDTLFITGISNTAAQFSASYDSSVLDIGDSARISVSFSTASVGNFTDTITLTTNIGSFNICLSGTGTPAPVISTHPPILFGQVFNCGDSINVPLTIKNTGIGDLIYSTTDTTTAIQSGQINIVAFTNSVSFTEWNNVRTTINTAMPNATITEVTTTSATAIATVLTGQDLIIIPETNNLFQLNNAITEIQAFVNNGGALIQLGMFNTTALIASGIFQGTYQGSVSGTALTTSSVNHPITTGTNSSFFGPNATAAYTITNPGYQSLVDDQFSNSNVGVVNYGSGKAALIGFDYFASSNDADTILLNAINWAAQTSINTTDWLGGNNPLDTLASNDSIVLNITFYSDSLSNGTYYSTLSVNSNDPVNPLVSVPCTLQVSGQSQLTIVHPTSCFDFDSIPNGSIKIDSLTITNTGCDTLKINGLSFTGTSFSAQFSNNTILPGDSSNIELSFIPNSLGAHDDSLSIQFVGGSQKFCVSGYSSPSPTIQATPNPLNVTINSCNDSLTVPLVITNTGTGAMVIDSIIVKNFDNTLDSVLSKFVNSGTTLPNLMPFSYLFSDGIIGNSISDGGNDMYDGGNLLNITRTGISTPTNLSYSDNVVSANFGLGTNGQYFTKKINGMFLFAADINNVSSFSIDGNLGADGRGIASGSIITSTSNGITYKGFIKKVYNAGDPSVNHLIIVADDPSITQTYSTNTDDDNHIVSGLSNATRIYYLLFAGSSGRLYSDAEIQVLMDNFLQTINVGSNTQWLSVQNTPITIPVGASDTINPKFVSSGLVNGQYSSSINIYSNDPNNPDYAVACNLTVNGTAELQFVGNGACLNFGNQFRFSRTEDSLIVFNSGCETAYISNASAGTAFNVTSYPDSILTGDSAYVKVEFFPGTLGAQADSVKLFYQGGQSKANCLQGNSSAPPQLTLLPSSITASINACNDSVVRTLTIKNDGSSILNWNILSGSSSYSDDFENGFNGALWATTNTVTTIGTCGTINGSASALFTGSNRTLETISLDATTIDSVSFVYRNGGSCDRADGSEYLYFQYSLNGTIWTNIVFTSTAISGTTTRLIQAQIPVAARTASTQFRFIQTSYSGPSNDFWIIDDFELISSGGRNNSTIFSFSQDSASLVTGDSSTVSLTIKANTLSPGLQTLYVRVNSNDPQNPVDSIPVFLNVSGLPCADYTFDATSSCNGTVSFRDTSLGNPTFWFWTFGDGNSSNLQHPINTYAASGTYSTRLVACNAFGCDTITQQIVVNSILAPRTASCTPQTNNYCCNYGIINVVFNSISNISFVSNYEDFSCTQSTNLTAGSSYPITVTTGNLEDAYGWIDYNDDGNFQPTELIFTSLSNTVHTATFTVPGTAVTGRPLRLRLGSQDNGSPALTGCNAPFRGQYEDYTVIIQSLTTAPIANFSDTLISSCQGVASFTDNSLNFPTSWAWDFGDGNTSSLRNPFHTYATRGTYQVQLIATNAFGTDSITKSIFVDKPTPVINVTGSLVPNSPLSFAVSGVTGGSNYNWNLGNGTTSTSATPTATYASSGSYTVTVNFVDANNCNVNATTTVNIIAVGIGENSVDNDKNVRVYPNPVINNLTVSTDFSNYDISIYTSTGSLVYTGRANQNNMLIDVSNLSANVYYLVINKGDDSFRKIFVKTK